MTLNSEVFKKTVQGGIWIGHVAGFFSKSDGTQWVVCEMRGGEIFVSEQKDVKNIRELYGVR